MGKTSLSSCSLILNEWALGDFYEELLIVCNSDEIINQPILRMHLILRLFQYINFKKSISSKKNSD